MKLLLIIEVDTNDGDYVTSQNYITKQALDRLLPLFAALKVKNGKWPFGEQCPGRFGTPADIYGDLLTEAEIQSFEESYCPYPEGGFHSINTINVYEVTKETNYL